MKKTSFFLLVISVITFYACKPTVENENNKFIQNMKTANYFSSHTTIYSFIKKHATDKAYKVYLESKKITDEEKKAEKLAQANQIFDDNKLYSEASSIKARLENIDRLISKVQHKAGKSKYRKYRSRVNSAVDSANQAKKEATDMLKGTRAANADEALKKADEANDKLSSAESKLDSIDSKMKKKRKKRKK